MRLIKYEIMLKEPVRIVDTENGKPGESVCKSYIPGTTIRGAVLSRFRKELTDDATFRKAMLGGKTRFMNAYPVADGKQLYPSPMGFYESKLSDGTVENILAKDDPTPGYKRAGLGEFAVIEDDTVKYMSVSKKDMLGIDVSGKKMFRSVVLSAGQVFGGSIFVGDDYADRITECLKSGDIKIGSSVTAGLGLCSVSGVFEKNIDEVAEDCVLVGSDKITDVTMMLLSPMAMRNEAGEICGIDEAGLKGVFGADVVVEKQSTSTIKVSGVNRTWGCRTPEITMYKAGSVFKLSIPNGIERSRLIEIAVNGVGVNTSEGCGMVAFLDGFERIVKKCELSKTPPDVANTVSATQDDVDKVKKAAAKIILTRRIREQSHKYILDNAENELKGIKSAQLGVVLNWAKNLEYRGVSTKDLGSFLVHEKEKRDRDSRHSVSSNGKEKQIILLEKYNNRTLGKIIDFDTNVTVMGYTVKDLFSDDEMTNMKFKVLAQLITFHKRGENDRKEAQA